MEGRGGASELRVQGIMLFRKRSGRGTIKKRKQKHAEACFYILFIGVSIHSQYQS